MTDYILELRILRFYLPSAGIIGIWHHAQQEIFVNILEGGPLLLLSPSLSLALVAYLAAGALHGCTQLLMYFEPGLMCILGQLDAVLCPPSSPKAAEPCSSLGAWLLCTSSALTAGIKRVLVLFALGSFDLSEY